MPTRKWLVLVAIAVAAAATASAWYWQSLNGADLPPAIIRGNGRLEADEVDIATKFAGRVAEILVDEGDDVTAGQLVAQLDTRELEAEHRRAEAELEQAKLAVERTKAEREAAKADCSLAQQEYDRALFLVRKGSGTQETLDRRRSALQSARASCNAAEAAVAHAEAQVDLAMAVQDQIEVRLDDSQLTSPVDGRVLYRLAQPGEVLAAGGKVVTVIDTSRMYMTIFLPEQQVGRVPVGADARVVLDALPARPLDGRVTFVSPQAQFTPKEVETASEREKLSFRIKVMLTEPPEPLFKPGMPGVALVRTDEEVAWPASVLTPEGT